MKTKRKTKLEGFEELSGPILELQPLKHHPELVALDQEIQGLRAKKTELDEQLFFAVDRPIPPAQKINVAADAEAIRTGVAVASLVVDKVETSKDSLRRQIAAVKKRLLDAGEEHKTLRERLIKETCEQIRPEVEAYMIDYMDCLESLQACLERNAKLWQFLSRSGLQTGYRPAHWTLTPYDGFLLHSGNGFSTLQNYIESRRKAWKIEN